MPFPALLAAAIPGIISAGSQAIGGAVGSAAGAGDREAQRRLIESLLREYGDLDVPELEQMFAEQLGPSAQEGVRGAMDPRFAREQHSVLDSLKRLEEQGGETSETRAVLNKILGDTARQESAGRNAILNNMKSRGVSGSGAELAMQLQNNQQSADQSQRAGLEQSAQANRRLLDVIMGRGNMAGQMRGQDYRELSDSARAKDMISQYNADNRYKTQYTNKVQLPGQQFGMEMDKMRGKTGLVTGASDYYGKSAQNAANTGYGVGNAIGTGGGAFAKEYFEEEEKKKKAGGTP